MLMHLYQTFINQEIYANLLGDQRYLLLRNEEIHRRGIPIRPPRSGAAQISIAD